MRRTVAVVVAIAGLLVAVPSSAAADAGGVDFADGSTLKLQPGKSAPVTLVNNVGLPYEVTVATTLADGTEVGASPPVIAHLDAGGIVTVMVTAPGSAEATGFLVAVARTAGAPVVVARRPFRVAAAADWTPLVGDWRVTSFSGPVTRGLRNASVPLANGGSCGDVSVAAVVGGVARPSGGSATVTATCRAGAKHVELSFAGLAEAGYYKGTIDLAPDAEHGTVALTVQRTADVVYPVVLLITGIALALLVAWQSGRLSALSRAREETWLLQAEAAAAHQRFPAAGEGATWQAYSFLTALRVRLDAVRAALRGLRWLFSEITVEQGPYKKQLDVLSVLSGIVDTWEPFADRLAALATSRGVLTAELGSTKPPKIVAHTDDLLHGRELADVSEVLPLIAAVEAAITATRSFRADLGAVRELRELSAKLGLAVPEGPDRRRLNEATATIDSIHDAMWKAPDGTAYNSLSVDTLLAEPAVQLNALRIQYLTLVSAGIEPVTMDGPVRPVPDVRRTLRQAQENAAATARRIARSRRMRNGLAFLAIAVVTVWTGLTALYFDRAFGTWRDYVTIVAWGFGAQAGLTALAGALDRIIADGKVIRP